MSIQLAIYHPVAIGKGRCLTPFFSNFDVTEAVGRRIEDVIEIVDAVDKHFGDRIDPATGRDNRYKNPVKGYRDYQFVVNLPNGLNVEIQVMDSFMAHAKDPGHDFYGIGRNPEFYTDDVVSPWLKVRYEKMMFDLYSAAYSAVTSSVDTGALGLYVASTSLSKSARDISLVAQGAGSSGQGESRPPKALSDVPPGKTAKGAVFSYEKNVVPSGKTISEPRNAFVPLLTSSSDLNIAPQAGSNDPKAVAIEPTSQAEPLTSLQQPRQVLDGRCSDI